MSKGSKHFYEFGPFRVDPDQRLLLRDNRPVPLQPKAFDTLLLLIQRSETLVLKDDLMKSVWPDTFVEESNLAQNIFVLRKTLGEVSGEHRYIVTVPGRGYRFTERVNLVPQRDDIVVQSHSITRVMIDEQDSPDRVWQWGAVAAVLAVALLAGTWYWRSHRLPKLTAKDSIVIADFANTTGDPVFDGTLRQGLSAQMEQSPFLNLVSDQRTAQTLSLMGQPKDGRLTHELAQEVCQRTASAAVLDGSIAQIGSGYLLTLRALECATGETLESTEAQAIDKNHVLDALGKMASETRTKLGESLASVRKYDVAPENVTTPSLDALQAYSLGRQAAVGNRALQAIPLYDRAVRLDPNFAAAYLGRSVNYFNLDETSQAAENIQKAYDLRDRVSERERLGIEIVYAAIFKRDFEAARKSEMLFTEIYPRDTRGIGNLAVFDGYLGDYDQALVAEQKALRLNPGSGQLYSNLVIDYMHLNRLAEARAIAAEAKSRNLDSTFLHANLYLVEFLRHDAVAMEREAAEAIGKPGSENEGLVLYYESDTAADGGQFMRARELTRRAIDSAARSGAKESVAEFKAEAAVREALVGNLALAKQQAADAQALSKGRDVAAMSAIALALAGDSAAATRLGDDLGARFPDDTVVRYNSVPAIRAATALRGGDPRKAVDELAVAMPYEMGQTAQQVTFVLYPVYLRGEAYLATRQGAAAAAEFRKILDHPGLVQNAPIGALAQLGLARAYVLSGEGSKVGTAYQAFFNLWKDADREVPILKAAKTEYTKAQ
jgi:DNA-binding winged helix-turn-helix (wHTH) protein/tetratricopeptide (TPR) repeat protein